MVQRPLPFMIDAIFLTYFGAVRLLNGLTLTKDDKIQVAQVLLNDHGVVAG